jgi:ABC-2 type transport system permease protein
MLRLIAAKDLREFIRDGRLYWAGGVVILLLLTSLAVGWQRQREIDAERAAARPSPCCGARRLRSERASRCSLCPL